MSRFVALLLALALLTAAPDAQVGRTATRRVATLTALVTYPTFYHLQPVRIRGAIREQDALFQVEYAGVRVFLIQTPGATMPDAGSTAEVTGTFVDVGRLEQSDARNTGGFAALSERLLRKPWPGIGELFVILVDGSSQAEPLAAPSVRAVALDPDRYADQEVTVVGRFRGRNLYGDLADAPGKSRWDFVLQSADAAVWVTGRRPRGDRFDLNVDNRVDTGRWLEVAGVVKVERGLTRLEATAIRAAEAPAQTSQPEATVRVPVAVPPPEVVFSAPTAGETDVEPNASIRVQFSRDLTPESIKGQVGVAYVGVSAPPPAFATTYDPGRRMLEIKFAAPLEPFRTVEVSLKDGIQGTDKQPLTPWTLSFSVGS